MLKSTPLILAKPCTSMLGHCASNAVSTKQHRCWQFLGGFSVFVLTTVEDKEREREERETETEKRRQRSLTNDFIKIRISLFCNLMRMMTAVGEIELSVKKEYHD